MEFKDMLKKLRESQGLPQVALSEKLGMSKSIIGLYETGERMASKEALDEIADYFNVTLDYLTGRDDKSMYYLDPETAALAQQLQENEGMRVMLDDGYIGKSDYSEQFLFGY